jgi:hypothetical protein
MWRSPTIADTGLGAGVVVPLATAGMAWRDARRTVRIARHDDDE